MVDVAETGRQPWVIFGLLGAMMRFRRSRRRRSCDSDCIVCIMRSSWPFLSLMAHIIRRDLFWLSRRLRPRGPSERASPCAGWRESNAAVGEVARWTCLSLCGLPPCPLRCMFCSTADLGVGALLLLQPREIETMVDSITDVGWQRDMAHHDRVALAAFPIAYRTLRTGPPSSSVCDGIGCESHLSFVQINRYRRRWGRDLCNRVDWQRACGSFLAPYSRHIGRRKHVRRASTLLDLSRTCALRTWGYVVLGGCWLEYKTSALLRIFGTALRIACCCFFSPSVCRGDIILRSTRHCGRMEGPPFADRNSKLHRVDCALILFGSIGKRRCSSLAAGMVMIAAGLRSCNHRVPDGCGTLSIWARRVRG